ncbi:hypothetical protein GCM10018952_14410 [Streptosporangium vulgare]
MARDGLIPRSLSKINRSYRSPTRVTLIIGFLAILLAEFVDVLTLEPLVVIGALFVFIAVAGGVVRMRQTMPDLPRGFRTPLSPGVPIASILACLWLMVNLQLITWLYFIIWMAFGVLVYLVYGRRNSVLATTARPVPETPARPSRGSTSTVPGTGGRTRPGHLGHPALPAAPAVPAPDPPPDPAAGTAAETVRRASAGSGEPRSRKPGSGKRSEAPGVDHTLHELPGAGLARIGEDLLGGASFQEHAAVEEADGVGDLAAEAHLVGGEDHGHAPLLELPDDPEHLLDERRVQGRGDLVQQHQARLGWPGP